MNVGAVLERDPAAHPLVNRGQARIVDDGDPRAAEELRGELATFVCEGQYADGVQRILRSFLDDLERTNQRGAWVSGFFGSGKSHFLKMLLHLWSDTRFPDGATARGLVPALPPELEALLRELDVAGRRAGGLVAAAGSLPSGTTDAARRAVLSILLRGLGLPAGYPQAKFWLWLHAEGRLDAVKASVEAAGREFAREIDNLYVSGSIARALISSDPGFAAGEAEAHAAIRAQFPSPPGDIPTAEFLRAAREALLYASANERLPCALLVLDEAQQYIGDSSDRSTLVAEIAEAVAKELDSRVMIVAAGQSALTDAPLLQKLLDRFTVRAPLSDADVETVTRKVLLRKRPAAAQDVRALLETHAGEVSRQLRGTRIGPAAGDRATAVDDYPLLPARRRFWEECFRRIDAAGTQSQLRSQLRILHDAVAKLSARPLGAVVPGDELFDALAPEMVNTGVLPRELDERIRKAGEAHGALARRVCGLVFLIGRLPREAGADTGVRAAADHIADLAIDDIAADNGKLRERVAAALASLADDGVLMKVGGEYRLQTRQGAEWDADFRARCGRLGGDAAAVALRRDELLYGAVDRVVRRAGIVQGAAKEARRFVAHRGPAPPEADGGGIPLWIRDGWSASEKEARDAARAAGPDSPVVHVFVPRRSADELRSTIVAADAARAVLDERGRPTEAEGQEARRSMEGRFDLAQARRDALAEEIAAAARVFQGGGGEALSAALAERLDSAGRDSLARLFPRFAEADSASWPAAIARARQGADKPLQPVGHDDATEKHPVCREAIAAIGAGASGAAVRKALAAPPFGWPRDAVDAALIALHRSRHLTATLNGAAVAPGALDQNKAARAEFRVERKPLSIQDRLALRKLFQTLGVSCAPGEEDSRAGEFLSQLSELARSAGGDPPLPAPPAAAAIEECAALLGNERLAAARAKADEWSDAIPVWRAAKARAEARMSGWRLVERLAAHAAPLEDAAPLLEQVEAIRGGRQLLDESDPAAHARKALADLLRGKVGADAAAHERAHADAAQELEENDAWRRLGEDDRASLLAEAGLAAPETPEMGTDAALADHLDRRSFSAARAEVDAIPARTARAVELAAQRLEPKARAVSVERATLRNAADVEAWTERQKKTLLDAVTDGPVLVN